MTSHSHLPFMSNRIGGPPIQLKDIVANDYAVQLFKLRIERFWRSFAAMRTCLQVIIENRE